MKTNIQWTESTWNPVRGCTPVSPGCANCYAQAVAKRFSGPGQPYDGLVDERGHWTRTVRLVPEKLGEPLRWRTPRMIFVDSMSDLFHAGVPFEFVAAVFGVMAATPWHTYQVLTKRPKRALAFAKWLHSESDTVADIVCEILPGTQKDIRFGCGLKAMAKKYGVDPGDFDTKRWPLPNVWIGVSVENQETADERIPDLLDFPAAVRWVSYEPALGPVDFERIADDGIFRTDVLRGRVYEDKASDDCSAKLDWIVVGGESGAKARSFDILWLGGLIATCARAGTPLFVKQLGANCNWPQGWKLKDRKGGDPSEWADYMRVRQWPEVQQ